MRSRLQRGSVAGALGVLSVCALGGALAASTPKPAGARAAATADRIGADRATGVTTELGGAGAGSSAAGAFPAGQATPPPFSTPTPTPFATPTPSPTFAPCAPVWTESTSDGEGVGTGLAATPNVIP